MTITTVPEGAEVVQLRPLQQPEVVLGTSPLQGIRVTIMDEIRFDHQTVPGVQELLRHAGTLVVRICKPGYMPFEGVLWTDSGRLVEHRIVLKPEQ